MEPRAKLLLASLLGVVLVTAAAYAVGRHDGGKALRPESDELTQQLAETTLALETKEGETLSLSAVLQRERLLTIQQGSVHKLDVAVRALIARNTGIAEQYIREATTELEGRVTDPAAAETVRELAGLLPLDPADTDAELTNLVEVISELEQRLLASASSTTPEA